MSRSLEQFDVKEKRSTYLTEQCPNVTVWTTLVELVEPSSHLLHLANGKQLNYDKLCICTGGRPKVGEKVKLTMISAPEHICDIICDDSKRMTVSLQLHG